MIKESSIWSMASVSEFNELPQIFNVLIGNMSLVGPRPLLMEYLSLYDDEQIKRHNVLPWNYWLVTN